MVCNAGSHFNRPQRGQHHGLQCRVSLQQTSERTASWSAMPGLTSTDLREDSIMVCNAGPNFNRPQRGQHHGLQCRASLQQTSERTASWSAMPGLTSTDLREDSIMVCNAGSHCNRPDQDRQLKTSPKCFRSCLAESLFFYFIFA